MSNSEKNRQEQRRKLLKYFAASPLALAGVLSPWSSRLLADDTRLEAMNSSYGELDKLIKSVNEAVNVFDFEKVAKATLPPAHYGYVATGVDDNRTLQANRAAFSTIQLRARRMVDISRFNMSVELFGKKWPSPIALAPVSSQASMHPLGDIATGQSCGKTQTLQIHSSFASKSIEQVSQAAGTPPWFQLYAADSWDTTMKMVRRAEAAGCEVMVLTIDMYGGSNRETLKRFINADNRDCQACHTKGHFEKPMTAGMNYQIANSLTWAYVRRLKDSTKMKLILKGVVTGEDALLAIKNGADGIIVSNHGGRAAETGRATIDSLPEVIAAVKGKVPVLIDSGFRRGTDIFKALALGADAVCIGRPYLWGLAAFGAEGVEGVIGLLRKELELIMKKTGAVTLDQIDSDCLV
ncbi:alpha-hydroxy acid oxidase [Porticoccus sp. GXU_MW_L64]